MKHYTNIHNRQSIRLKGYDYSLPGMYFITICTNKRKNLFGNIEKSKMYLSDIGIIVDKCWHEIPSHFPFVELDEFVIMPNHIHGIIEIVVGTQDFVSLQSKYFENPNRKFGVQSMNLSSIIRGFKIGVKKWATINNVNFAWQTRFYDHIIRNEKDLNRIREYIIYNPLKWNDDEYYR